MVLWEFKLHSSCRLPLPQREHIWNNGPFQAKLSHARCLCASTAMVPAWCPDPTKPHSPPVAALPCIASPSATVVPAIQNAMECVSFALHHSDSESAFLQQGVFRARQSRRRQLFACPERDRANKNLLVLSRELGNDRCNQPLWIPFRGPKPFHFSLPTDFAGRKLQRLPSLVL